MRKANFKDKIIVTNILVKSFQNDPHVSWLLEKCKNKNKLKILMNYVFDETIRRGEIYLTHDNAAVALWDSEQKERITLHFILRNFSFLLRIGLSSVMRILKSEGKVHKNFRKHKKYFHLFLISVMPESQGQGLASLLMNPILQEKTENGIPVFLETANKTNVEIYKRKGFVVFDILSQEDKELYLMTLGKFQAKSNRCSDAA